MIWINFDIWNSNHGHFLSWQRIYKKGKRTPFCRIEKRYDTWLGYWKKPKSMAWLLVGRTITFAGIPSDAQMQEAVDAVRPLGLVPTDQALASAGVFELYLKEKPTEPDWRISVPDGHAGTTTITYKGKTLHGVTAIYFGVRGGERAYLELEIFPAYLEAILNDLQAEIKVKPCE